MKRSLVRAATLAGGAGLAAGFYAWFVERTQVQLNHFTIAVDKPGLPLDGLIILHLSDLHLRAGGRLQQWKLARLQRLLAGTQYDILALTGDLIHDAPGFDAALSFVKTLHPRLGAFFCPGNHDYCESSLWGIFGPGSLQLSLRGIRALVGNLGAFGRKLRQNERVHLPVAYHDVPRMQAALLEQGVQSLVNRAVHLAQNGTDLWLAGIDDLWEGSPDLARALSGIPRDALLLLLAHNPDVWLDSCVERTDLVLCGHVHGGQVRLPAIGAVHTQGTHLTRRAPDGWFSRAQTRMFVSRGVGESLPVRFGAPPQAALIRLVRLNR